MDPDTDTRVPVLSDLGDALERAVYTEWYRWFVRLLIPVVLLLGTVHVARLFAGDLVSLSAETARLVELATSLALGLFVLAGTVQLVVFARGVRRRETIVAKSAEDVERSADDVTKVAEELDEAIDDPSRIEDDPEDIETTVEQAEEQATDAKETVEKVKGELNPPDDTESTDDDGTGDAAEDVGQDGDTVEDS